MPPITLACHAILATRRADCARYAQAQGWNFIDLPSPVEQPAAWRSVNADIFVLTTNHAQLASMLDRILPMPPHRSLMILLDDSDAACRARLMLAGADDVQSNAIDRDELHARLFALARRRAQTQGMLWCDELAIDLVGREVRRDGQLITMPMREFGLIARLAMSPNQPVSRGDLLRAVWQIDFDPGTNRIDVHVSRLRRRVDHGRAHAMLRTVKGLGYALVSREGAAAFL